MPPPKRQQNLDELFESANRHRTNTIPINEESEDTILRTKLELATETYEAAQDKIKRLQEQLRERTAELEAYDDAPDNDSANRMKILLESRSKYFMAVTEARKKEMRAREEFLAVLRKVGLDQVQWG
ncbi:hypothetical protein BFW01_g11121 [Lasiodiplodia theobromae]|uniref:Mfs sugar transporter n=1 Tax=Lasiodiplodia theobromae TaxID=45133 RepID=UPI0015C3755C|nr:Mfs sugar transporter [Lasiodiplodia theobromae]KAF4539501.1 Mfs sugar transporter [Lasiodiplodia theobromae]KAF9639315.1 hypothetical protein BFW01_g11121 [Lasiodiplodia theobromae]